jgi:hypothetical protein
MIKCLRARFDWLSFSASAPDTLHGEARISKSGTEMVITVDRPDFYRIEGVMNEVGGFEGRDRSNGVEAHWAETIPGQYHGLWIENGERYLFQIETDE